MHKQPPNILFILIDDLGAVDLASFGSTFYSTPNLDRLAQRGMVFTDAYASCPVCSPTRGSLLTGRYPARIGLTDWIDFGGRIQPARGKLVDVPYIRELPRTEVTSASLLRGRGYSTWHVGKWHLGFEETYPEQHGFDVNIGGGYLGAPGPGGYFSPFDIPNLPPGSPGQYLPEVLTDEAINLIRNRSDNPFFLNMCFYLVHTPIEAPADRVAKWEARVRELGLDRQTALVEGEFFPMEHKRHLRVTRRILQSDPVYAAMVENMDENVGRLLDTLEEEGIADDTLVVFTSDNGGLATSESSPTCNSPYAEGKGWMYEGGTRVPMIAAWPGRIPAGSRTAEPVCSIDLFPTWLTQAGIPVPDHLLIDGEDLSPVLFEGAALERDALFWHYPHYGNQGGTPGSSIRSGDWKLIEFYEDNRLELYNFAEDIGEDHNLAEEEPEHTRTLHQRLKTWRESVAARIPTPNPDWQE